jgi:hypothetical protein
MRVSDLQYTIYTVCLLHISASHVVIFREVRRDGQIHRNITEDIKPMLKYNIFMQKYQINILYLCVGPKLL